MSKLRIPPVGLAKTIESLGGWVENFRRKLAPAPISLLHIGFAHWQGQALMVAAELGVADHLKSGPQSVTKLAELVGAHEESLFRVLRALAAIKIFREGPDRHFSLTKLARPLLSDAPDSVRACLIMTRQPFHWQSWGDLMSAVKTGRSSLEIREGKNLFEYLSKNKKDGEIFDNAMTAVSSLSAPYIAQGFNFSQFKVLADIGGGHGHFLSLILKAHPGIRGILFDQDHVVAGAPSILSKNGVQNRCEVISGSFFDSIPPGADAYLLKNIIHDWDDENSRKILSAVRRSMIPKSKLLLVETVVPADNSYHPGKVVDLEMLVHTPGGKERTEKQHADLLAKSGFRLTAIHKTVALECVIEAEPL